MTRVAVVGAGAMGGVWAAHLAGAGRAGGEQTGCGAGHEVTWWTPLPRWWRRSRRTA